MIFAVLLGALALLVVAGAIYQAIGTWRDRRRFPPSGRLVRVNERRMHIHVIGEGTPTVVFESGMGASCLSWTLVQAQVAQFTCAVSYSRARGLFAGISLAGSTLRPDNGANKKLYGKEVSAKDIVFNNAVPVPDCAKGLHDSLEKASPVNESKHHSVVVRPLLASASDQHSIAV